MCVYTLTDRATGEEIEVDATTVERITGIEVSYIKINYLRNLNVLCARTNLSCGVWRN